MGRLVGLELHNFKSYKGTVQVGFGDSNFTSIIGPNGSGKSNMMDAISFVLGVRSSHLRSNILKDLIYRGVLEEEGSTVSNGENDDNNPQYAHVKAFYLKGNTTVELMRSIAKSGDTTYRMNGKAVNYKKFASFLEDENILIKAKNFLVFQGDVVAIASQSPSDLSNLFEEVSGSIQYKKEYELLKEQVQRLAQSAAESIKNRRRVHGELKTYKEGIHKNQEYSEKLKEKNELEQNLALWQLYHLEQKKSELNNNLREFKTNMKGLKEKIGDEEKNLTRAKSSYTKDNTLVTKQNSYLEVKVKEREKANAQLLPIKLSEKADMRRVANIEKKKESLQKDIERQRFYVNKFENQLKVVTRSKETFEKELSDASGNFDKYTLTEADLKIYKELNEKYLNSGGFDLESKMALLENDKEEVQSDIELVEKRLALSKSRIMDELSEIGERLELQMTELTTSLNEKNASHNEDMKKLKRLQSEIESSSNKEYDLNYKLRETLIKIDDLSAYQRETNKERKLRENVATLKKFFPGVRGLVSDLCQPKKDRYALAVSTILGKNFDSVIVDSLSVAQECIAFLKKQRAGVVSLIPLDTLDAETPVLAIPDNDGCMLTINAINYDQEYERAMQYVCSDSIICDTLTIAQDLKWNKKVKSKLVTLEGSLIHRAGLMTGGISKDSNNRWDREEYQSLMTLKDQLQVEIEEVSNYSRNSSLEARNLEGNLSTLNGEISDLRTQISQLKRSIEENETEIKYHQNLIGKEYEPKQQGLREKVSKINEAISHLSVEKEDLQKTIFESFTSRKGFSIKEFENHSGEMMRQQNKELQELQRQILNIENKLEFEKERLAATEKRLDKTQNDLVKVKSELVSLRSREQTVQKDIQKLEDEVETIRSGIHDLERVLDAKQNDINSTDEILDEQNKNFQLMKKERDDTKDEIEKINLERACLLKNCKISNMSLPVSSVIGIQALPIDSIDENAIEIANEIRIGFETLPEKYKESNADRVQRELENSIKEIQVTLSELQPNSNATDRFTEAQVKFESIDHETERLKNEERKVLAQFLKVKKKRKQLFESAFEYVSDHIDPIYRELTRNPNSTSELTGGSASLTLEDEDEPFNAGIKYHATPPLKRFKDMEYLSGGEKTVAALALLFTINSYQPSPFFVLDEVDAALDTANVERIATYIRRHGNSDLQFIVISLKNTMFEKSDALVGVYREQQMNTSRIVTLNLENYAS